MSKNMKRLIYATIIGSIFFLLIFVLLFKILPSYIGVIVIMILGLIKITDIALFLSELIVDKFHYKNDEENK